MDRVLLRLHKGDSLDGSHNQTYLTVADYGHLRAEIEAALPDEVWQQEVTQTIASRLIAQAHADRP